MGNNWQQQWSSWVIMASKITAHLGTRAQWAKNGKYHYTSINQKWHHFWLYLFWIMLKTTIWLGALSKREIVPAMLHFFHTILETLLKPPKVNHAFFFFFLPPWPAMMVLVIAPQHIFWWCLFTLVLRSLSSVGFPPISSSSSRLVGFLSIYFWWWCTRMSLVVVLALQQRQRLSEQCIRRIIKSSQPGQTISLIREGIRGVAGADRESLKAWKPEAYK